MQTDIQSKLDSTRSHNEELWDGIKGQREEVEMLVSGLESVIRDLEGANEVMDGVLLDGELRRETMSVDGEIRAGMGAKL